jgi:hypothetical protein
MPADVGARRQLYWGGTGAAPAAEVFPLISDAFAESGATIGAGIPETGSSAIYIASIDKLIAGWEAWDGRVRNNSIRICDMSVSPPSWGPKYRTSMSALSDDDHGSPSFYRDDDGYIWEFGGCHGNTIKVSRSTNVDDPSVWTAQTAIAGTWSYPTPVKVGTKVYLFARRSDNVLDDPGTTMPLHVFIGTPTAGVMSWSASNPLLDLGADSRCYRSNCIVRGTDIHFTVSRADYSDTTRQDTFYLIYDTLTGNVSNYNKSVTTIPASLPIGYTLAKASYRVVDQRTANTTDGGMAGLAFDSAGNAHIAYMDGSGTTYNVYHITSDLVSAWSSPVLVGRVGITTSHVCYRSHVTCTPCNTNDIQVFWPTEDAVYHTDSKGGAISRRVRLANGTWQTAEVILAQSSIYAYDMLNPVVNGTAKCRVIFGEGTNLQSGSGGSPPYSQDRTDALAIKKLKAFVYGEAGGMLQSPYCPYVDSYAKRCAVQPDATHLTRLNAFVRGMIADDVWGDLYSIIIPIAATQQQGLLDWRVAGYTPSVVGTIVFTADGGVASNGTTGLLRSTMTWSKLDRTNCAAGHICLVEGNGNVSMGSVTNNDFNLETHNGGTELRGKIASSLASASSCKVATSTAKGLNAIARASSNFKLWKDGVNVATLAVSGDVTFTSAVDFLSRGGTFSTDTFGMFFTFGKAPTQAQWTAFRARAKTFIESYGLTGVIV